MLENALLVAYAAIMLGIVIVFLSLFAYSKLRKEPGIKFRELTNYELAVLRGTTKERIEFEEYLNSQQFPPIELTKKIFAESELQGVIISKLRILSD